MELLNTEYYPNIIVLKGASGLCFIKIFKNLQDSHVRIHLSP